MKEKIIIPSGETFGDWTVIDEWDVPGRTETHYLCQCACGYRKPIRAYRLKRHECERCYLCFLYRKTNVGSYSDYDRLRHEKVLCGHFQGFTKEEIALMLGYSYPTSVGLVLSKYNLQKKIGRPKKYGFIANN